MNRAPYHEAVAEAPPGGAAYWVVAKDQVTLRTVVWPKGDRGTVFVFPGRTEYAEKYGRTAVHLNRAGYAALAIDWRGQGLADRRLGDPMIGHVDDFAEYQRDAAAVIALAAELQLPRPWFLLAHSMGGCIGLRTLEERRDFAAAAFSAPMWGIVLPRKAAVIPLLRGVTRATGHNRRLAPSTTTDSYVLTAPFEGNVLTRDREMWDYIHRQTREQPRFALGGPSLGWLAAAMVETRRLGQIALPDLPVFIGAGTEEAVVERSAIDRMAARWAGAAFQEFDLAEHELLMERPEVRDGMLDRAVALFESVRTAA